MANVYGNGSNSTVGVQIRTDYFYKKALIDLAKEQYFGQMADTISMPKNMGKTIKRYHYLPILDDRNLNDQGIDASGALLGAGNGGEGTSTAVGAVAYIKVAQPDASGTAGAGEVVYFRGDDNNATLATAQTNALNKAKANVRAWLVSKIGIVDADGSSTDTTYAELNSAGSPTSTAGLAFNAGYIITEIPATASTNYGNLYGSSKDIGTIQSKIPALSETGGRVNRVGMKRIELEGTLSKYGFFDEWTQESMDFDSDSELMMHLNREMLRAANEITEDQLMIDLLNSAGVVRYTGTATSAAQLQGNDVLSPFASDNTNDTVSYDDLVKLAIELDNNRCPKHTKIITGSRMVDTKVVNAARYMYIGSELLPSIMRMTDYHGNKAFIPVAQYASAGTVARGEVGAVDSFRFIVVPEMAHWEGAGANVATAEGVVYRHNGTKFNVYPMLVVGDASFTTIGFQTDGKGVKFKIITKKPGEAIADHRDPYGETGFSSIKWFYGFMVLRPERIALVKTIAEW